MQVNATHHRLERQNGPCQFLAPLLSLLLTMPVSSILQIKHNMVRAGI